MVLIIIIACFYAVFKLISAASAKAKERARQAQIERIKREQAAQREEMRRAQEEAKAEAKRVAALEREQERIAKEQERQAAQLAKHEEQIMKLGLRVATAESEIAFNREQRERLWKLLEIEELERDSAIEGSNTWQKHHRKVISLENQIHTVQKRIDKAQMDKAFCEKKLSA